VTLLLAGDAGVTHVTHHLTVTLSADKDVGSSLHVSICAVQQFLCLHLRILVALFDVRYLYETTGQHLAAARGRDPKKME
jgi:hypothetical protein